MFLLALRATAFLKKKKKEKKKKRRIFEMEGGRQRGVPTTHHERKFNLNSSSLRGGVLMVVVSVGFGAAFQMP